MPSRYYSQWSIVVSLLFSVFVAPLPLSVVQMLGCISSLFSVLFSSHSVRLTSSSSTPSSAFSCWWVFSLFLWADSSVELQRKMYCFDLVSLPVIPLLKSSSHLQLTLQPSPLGSLHCPCFPLYLTPNIHSIHHQALLPFLLSVIFSTDSVVASTHHVISCLNCCIILSACSLILHQSVLYFMSEIWLNIKWSLISHRIE